MKVPGSKNQAEATARLRSAQSAVAESQHELLEAIADCARYEEWRENGCRDFPQWVAAELQSSTWSARRWVNASEALPELPLMSAALVEGRLSIDKVLELSRFATPQSERRLIEWAKRVMPATIRRTADVTNAPTRDETVESDLARRLDYWWSDDGRALWLEACWPADQGAVIAKTLDRMAGRLPDIVDEDAEPSSFIESLEMRRADALYALASHRIAEDADADRATVVVHVDAETLAADHGGCEIEGGGVGGAETARRLAGDGGSSSRSTIATAAPSESTGRPARHLPGWFGSCAGGIEDAPFRAVMPAGSCSPTTSGTGVRGVRPISTTWSSPAVITTNWCTSMDGKSNSAPTTS